MVAINFISQFNLAYSCTSQDDFSDLHSIGRSSHSSRQPFDCLIKNTSQERELFWIVDSISFAHRAAPLPIIALQLRTLTRGLAAVGPKGDGPAAYIGEDAIQSSTDAVVQHNGSEPMTRLSGSRHPQHRRRHRDGDDALGQAATIVPDQSPACFAYGRDGIEHDSQLDACWLNRALIASCSYSSQFEEFGRTIPLSTKKNLGRTTDTRPAGPKRFRTCSILLVDPKIRS